MRDYEAEESIRRERIRRRRRAELRRRRRRRAQIKRAIVLGCGIFCILLLAGAVRLAVTAFHREEKKEEPQSGIQPEDEEGAFQGISALRSNGGKLDALERADILGEGQEEEAAVPEPYTAEETDTTAAVDSEAVESTYALLIDLDQSAVVVQRNFRDRMNPASMTKILTLLVAAEHIDNLDDTFTITREITDYSFSNRCSAVGFDVGERVTVRDLLYGTILPSGGDAAAALAYYVSGSLDAFVELMNNKLAELRLSDTTHFTNCVGLYDTNHYSTVYDIAVILKAALDNELCREILSAHKYTTSFTEQHPEGIELSNWFLRRIEDKDTYGEVVSAKTGYVEESGSCAASYYVSNSGKNYICVTGNAHSAWKCIYDQTAIYQMYTQ